MSGRVITESFRGGVAVTPSDIVLLAPTRGLYVGGTGNVTVDFADGTTGILLTAPALGVVHHLSVIRVKATGTTATAIVAIY